jgi:conjugal transfer ATP-binding protein TraC
MIASFTKSVESLKEWFAKEAPPGDPSPVADPDRFTTQQEYNRFSDVLPWTGYMPEERLFVLEGLEPGSIQAIAYTLELNPQTGATEDMAMLLEEIYRDAPVGCGIQMQLYGSPDIRGWLNHFQAVVRPELLPTDHQRQLMAKMTENRVRHYLHATRVPPVSSRPSVMRTYRAAMSVCLPATELTPALIRRLVDLRESHISKLSTYYQFSHIWDANDLIAWVRGLLNPGPDTLENPLRYDDGVALRYQMIERDTVINVSRNGLRLFSAGSGDEVFVRGFSVQGYPANYKLHQVSSFLGDAERGSMGYPCPFLITMGAEILNYDKDKSVTQVKAARAVQLAESPMAKIMPEMVKKAKDWRILQEAYDNGGGGIRLYHQVLVFPVEEQIAQADESTKAIWRSSGFTITNDACMQVQALLSALPMTLGPGLQRDINIARRASKKTITNAANLAPVLGEWTGVGAPVLSLMGRRGQVMGVNLFDNPSGNYNGCVVGTSGSGKSAFLNELAQRYLAMGAKVWIIDVGRSYEKLCRSLGGQFIEFSRDSDIVLNPFTMVTDIDEDMEMLKPLFAQMISPSRALSDYETSQVEIAIRDMWEEMGRRSSVDLLAKRLLVACPEGGTRNPEEELPEGEACDPRIRDLGVQLSPYTSAGSYGKYFLGEHTVNFNSNLVVLELEELKSKKDLQAVALFILMYRITQEMYLAPREQPKVVIMDEAWDLLSGGSTGDFIEAGYRRARKYGGSFLTGTQSLSDYERSTAAMAALENADWMFMLRQKPESVKYIETSKRMAFTPHMLDLVRSLRTEQGSYSEVFVYGGQVGYGVGMLLLDRYAQLMGSANARDFEAVRAKQEQGMSMADAIEAVLKDRGIYER